MRIVCDSPIRARFESAAPARHDEKSTEIYSLLDFIRHLVQSVPRMVTFLAGMDPIRIFESNPSLPIRR